VHWHADPLLREIDSTARPHSDVATVLLPTRSPAPPQARCVDIVRRKPREGRGLAGSKPATT